jgi:hypothetical protein
MKAWLCVGALALSSAIANADTWYVDDDGGPGVHFTSIQAAILAAADGDVIRVAPGNYGPILLNQGKSLSILGSPGAKTSAPSPNGIYLLPAGKTLLLSQLEISGLNLMNNQGTIVLHDLLLPSISGGATFNLSADVRLYDVDSTYIGLSVGNTSRMELVECDLNGKDVQAPGWPQPPGEPGLSLYGDSRAHAYRSRVRGGDGGDDWEFGIFGGSGGSGIRVTGSKLLLAGDAQSFVQSGSFGWPVGDTLAALALSSGAHARVSGFLPDSTSLDATSTQEFPAPADPTLTMVEPASTGAVWEVAVRAQAGSLPLLLVGRDPLQPLPTTFSAEVQLVVPTRTIAMPATDGSGLSTFAFALPMHLPKQGGLLFFAQANVLLPNGQTRFTNSVPLILR